MRVEFSYDIFVQQRFGGVSRYFTGLIDEFILRGVDLSLSAPLVRCRELPTIDGCRLRVIPTSLDRRGVSVALSLVAGTAERFRRFPSSRMNHSPSVLHWTNYSARSVPHACPQVVTVYDMIHEDHPDLFPNRRYSRAKAIRISSADAIIAISNFTASRLKHWYPEVADRVRVIHLGIPQPETPAAVNDSGDYVLFVGNRSRHKNFRVALEAYTRSSLSRNGVGFRVFGGGKMSSTEEDYIHALGIADNFSQMYGDRSALFEAYKKAHCLVYPSVSEGFGLPPLEAMSASCPVVASTGGAIPEVVGTAALLFEPQDAELCALHFDQLLELDQRKDMIQRGKKRIRSFTVSSCAEQTLDVYRGVL